MVESGGGEGGGGGGLIPAVRWLVCVCFGPFYFLAMQVRRPSSVNWKPTSQHCRGRQRGRQRGAALQGWFVTRTALGQPPLAAGSPCAAQRGPPRRLQHACGHSTAAQAPHLAAHKVEAVGPAGAAAAAAAVGYVVAAAPAAAQLEGVACSGRAGRGGSCGPGPCCLRQMRIGPQTKERQNHSPSSQGGRQNWLLTQPATSGPGQKEQSVQPGRLHCGCGAGGGELRQGGRRLAQCAHRRHKAHRPEHRRLPGMAGPTHAPWRTGAAGR